MEAKLQTQEYANDVHNTIRNGGGPNGRILQRSE